MLREEVPRDPRQLSDAVGQFAWSGEWRVQDGDADEVEEPLEDLFREAAKVLVVCDHHAPLPIAGQAAHVPRDVVGHQSRRPLLPLRVELARQLEILVLEDGVFVLRVGVVEPRDRVVEGVSDQVDDSVRVARRGQDER